ncbi:sulfatase-like hydrolase/transferase [Clostridium peptidivorans]|uniref:sulfatase-like hydrolase/transferase n=1 Tax=Clostridium peptidivorans TaxID=100174 RepID=UPI000BE365FD|nr:sulfatase-like hydrolase/transferase [Clostridium peptidivorans]
MDKVYENNIKLLQNVYGEKYFNKSYSNYNDNVEVERTRDNKYCTKLILNNRKLYLSSKYNTSSEVDKFISTMENFNINEKHIILIFGLSFGYHIEELLKKINEEDIIIVIEPDYNVFNEVLKFKDINSIANNDNLYLIVGNNLDNLKEKLTLAINYKSLLEYKLILLKFSQYDKIYFEFYKEYFSILDDLVKKEHINHFPLKTNNSTYIGESIIKSDNKEGFITEYYNEKIHNIPMNLAVQAKTEVLYGKINNKFSLEIKEDSVVPIAINDFETNVSINENGNQNNFKSWFINRYNYFKFKKGDKVCIEANKNIVVGNPIPLNQENQHKVKLVLNIFVDGLARSIFKVQKLEKMMPNTYNFFKKGAIFNNCYSNGEWTLPSVAGIFSGLRTAKNGMYHFAIPHEVGKDYSIISEIFKKNDYLTFQACGNWRKNPLYGYVKGFDRSVYKPYMITEETISLFLENMRAFSKRDKYVWLSFFDLHEHINLLPDISSQIDNSIQAHDYNEEPTKSVYKPIDINKTERYINEVKRLDFYLKIIYDFINENYKDDEILIVLCSDHGQSYIGEDSYVIGEERTAVPLMIRGNNIPNCEIDDFVENVDILPTILKHSNIDFDESNIDGKLPKALGGKIRRDYVYSETIYSGKIFESMIKDKEYYFYFKSENKVREDGRIRLGKYNVKLVNKNNNKDETENQREIVKKYKDVVLENIKDILIQE